MFIVFLTLKLAEIGAVASWSWWAVTAPLWGGFVLVLGILTVVLVIKGISDLNLAHQRLRRKVRKQRVANSKRVAELISVTNSLDAR
jgi:hypothetical protein